MSGRPGSLAPGADVIREVASMSAPVYCRT